MNRFVGFVLRCLVGAVFVFAGALKIFDPAGFAMDIANYRLMPHELINLVAIILPWLELVTGLMLVMGFWVRANALIIAGLTIVFLIAISQALVRGLDVTCGCFGTVAASEVGVKNLLIDLALLLMAAWLAWRARE